MRVLPYDELSPPMHRDRALLHLSAFGGVLPSREIALLRRKLPTFSEYVGLFAVEGGRVLGQLYVLRIPYEFSDGPGTISGIAAVVTRPDMGRTGIARRLLTEAHRRERRAGQRYCSLWTNRSWGAYALYESLGYRDVYAPPWTVHFPTGARPGGRLPKGVRAGRVTDLRALERLHDRTAEGRLGFRPRPPGTLLLDHRLRHLDPKENLLVASEGGALTGYAHLNRSPQRLICGELVAASPTARRALVEGVVRAAGGLPAAFQHTFVSDAPELFPQPPFAPGSGGWYVFMGCELGRAWDTSEARARFGTEDPRFLCLAGDLF